MNCSELDSCLHEFLDNELAAGKRNEVANHLASCRRCAVRVAEFEQADRQLRTVKAVAPPVDFLQQVRRKIEAEEKVAEPVSARKLVEPSESFWDVVARQFTFPSWVKAPLAVAAALVLVFVLFRSIQPRQTEIPAAYQLTRNEVERAKELDVAQSEKPVVSSVEELKGELRDEKKTVLHDRVEGVEDFVLALRQPDSAPVVVEDLPKAELSPPAPSEVAKVAPAKPEPLTVGGMSADTGHDAERAVVEKKLGETSASNTEAITGTVVRMEKVEPMNVAPTQIVVAVAPTTPPTMMPPPVRARTTKPAKKAPEVFVKPSIPSVTNLTAVRQSGWLDLSTRTFYLEFGKASDGGAFVRGQLDEKNRFIVTSTEVEGQLVELDTRGAASRGTVGWLELSSRGFVASRPGLKPSYPYLEGYQDRQGEFHPTSRRIFRAGN